MAKTYINKQEGLRSSSVHKETLKVLACAKKNLLSITVEHIKVLSCGKGDRLSRRTIQEEEWSLKEELFLKIVNWSNSLPLCLPGKSPSKLLLHEVLPPQSRSNRNAHSSLAQDSICILLSPNSVQGPLGDQRPLSGHYTVLYSDLSLSWFSTLQEMSVESPWKLPVSSDMLQQDPIWHPNPTQTHLIAWGLKGGASYNWDIILMWWRLYWHPEDNPQTDTQPVLESLHTILQKKGC